MKRFSLLLIALASLTLVNGRLGAFGGNVPTGLPGNFGIGCIDKNDNWSPDPTGPHRWKVGQACFDYSYQYLTSGWRTWSSPDGQWPVNELTLWEGQGENQVFTFYYNNGAASLPTTWFSDLMVLMQKIEANSTKKVIIHIEPDFLGFCIQKGVTSYNASGIVTVGSSTAPTGWPGTGTKAWNTTNYPDNLMGWVKAIRDMQTLVAPTHVLIAHHFTAWGVSSGSSGDAFGQPTSQADIDNILTQIAAYLKNIGGGSYSYMDLFFMDPSDRDAAWYNEYNGGSNIRWSAENYSLTWGSRSWATLAYVADKASSLVGMRCMFWQMPNGNHFYKLMNNTDGHYQDNYTQAFLPATNSNGSSGTPGDAISASSTTTGPGFWANHGLIGVLFGEGYYAAIPPGGTTNLTHLRDYGPADGVGTVGAYASYGGPGGVSPGQGQAALTTYSDNDGGFLRNAVAKYCSVGKFPLPGAAAPTATPTTCVCSPTPTPTRTPAPADCPLVLNTCDSLTANGTWAAGADGTSALNTNATYVTSGDSIKFTVSTAASFQDKVSVMTGFAPSNWTSFDRVTFDLYVDPANPLWSGTSTYDQFQIRVTNQTAGQYEVDPTGATAITISTGWNHLSFPLSWATVTPNGISSLFLVPSIGTAVAGGVYYIDNVVLHTDAACPTSTPTPTFNPNTATPTPTPTRTPADCPLVLNTCDSLTANGLWQPLATSGTASLNTNATYVTSGDSIKFTVLTASSFQDSVSLLAGFTPTNWTPYDRITFDLYIDPTNPMWGGASIYDQFQLRTTNTSAGNYEVDPTGGTALTVTTGWNHLSFPLSWATYNGNGITYLYLVPSIGTPLAGGVYYIDNIVLHSDTVCPPPTATSTVTPSSSSTRTVTPSATPTATLTATRTASPTPSASPSVTVTLTVPAATATATATVSPSASATRTASATSTASPSATPTASPSATRTASATLTASPSVTATASPSATRTASPTVTATPTSPPPGSTATSTSTVTGSFSPSPTGTRTASPTVTPSASPSPTAANSATPSSTPLGTLTDTPLSSATPSASASATALNTATRTQTALPSATASGTPSVTLSATPPPPGSTDTDTVTATPSRTITPTSSATATATPSSTATATPTATPSLTLTAAASATPLVTSAPSATPVPSATRTWTLSPTVSLTPSATLAPTQAGPTATPTAALLSVSGGPASDQGGSLLTLTGLNLPASGTVLWDGAPLPAGSVQVTVAGQAWQVSSPVSTAGTHVIAISGVTGSVSVTVVVSPKATPTPTLTPQADGGTLVIMKTDCVPNPLVAGLPAHLGVKLSGPAEDLHMKVYTEALVAVGSVDFGAVPAGWNSVSLPSWVAGLPQGTYYYVVGAERGIVKAARPAIGRLVVIK